MMATVVYPPNSYTLDFSPNTAWNSMFPNHVHVAASWGSPMVNKCMGTYVLGQHPVTACWSTYSAFVGSLYY